MTNKPIKGKWTLSRIKRVLAMNGIPVDRTHVRAAEIGSALTVKVLSEISQVKSEDGFTVFIKNEWVTDKDEFNV